MPRTRKMENSDGTPRIISPTAVQLIDDDQKKAIPAVVPEQAPSALPVKRPRGRPRKYPLPEAAPVIPAPEAPAPAGFLSTPVAKPPSPHLKESPRPAGPSVMDQIEAIIREAEARSGPAPVKRRRGRPRKNPLPGTVPQPGLPSTRPASVSTVPSPATLSEGPAVQSQTPHGASAAQPEPHTQGKSAGPARRPRQGAQPPEAFPRPRGRRPKERIPPFTIAPGNLSPFCPKCGTYIRLFKPKRGRWRRVCPRCQPDRLIEKRDPRFNLDKTGIPCKDRGKCRPERCVKALDCTEMARKGGIRGSSHNNAG
jgi:hypothetical protein